MIKKFTTLVLMMASFAIFLPVEASSSVKTENRTIKFSVISEMVQKGRGKWKYNRNRRRSGSWYGYRNYGQYRRTQVGNRRYRLVRRSYWRDGMRLTRWVRIYY